VPSKLYVWSLQLSLNSCCVQEIGRESKRPRTACALADVQFDYAAIDGLPVIVEEVTLPVSVML